MLMLMLVLVLVFWWRRDWQTRTRRREAGGRSLPNTSIHCSAAKIFERYTKSATQVSREGTMQFDFTYVLSIDFSSSENYMAYRTGSDVPRSPDSYRRSDRLLQTRELIVRVSWDYLDQIYFVAK